MHLLSMPPPPDLANWLMSNPALNLPLAPVTTMALTSCREWASRRQLNRALSTARNNSDHEEGYMNAGCRVQPRCFY